MNRKEWSKKHNRLLAVEYIKIHKILNDWMLQNGITERCDVHHRDDTEETRKYNEEHYERWGFNEDGTFEYGKYVIFMTKAEHTHYHKIGKKFSDEHRANLSNNHSHYWKDKQRSEETRAKISTTKKGKNCSNEHRTKISEAYKGMSVLYATYKNNGGTLKWHEFRTALKNGEITLADIN